MMPTDPRNIMLLNGKAVGFNASGEIFTTEYEHVQKEQMACIQCEWLEQTICTHLDCKAVHIGAFFQTHHTPPCNGALFERRQKRERTPRQTT